VLITIQQSASLWSRSTFWVTFHSCQQACDRWKRNYLGAQRVVGRDSGMNNISLRSLVVCVHQMEFTLSRIPFVCSSPAYNELLLAQILHFLMEPFQKSVSSMSDKFRLFDALLIFVDFASVWKRKLL